MQKSVHSSCAGRSEGAGRLKIGEWIGGQTVALMTPSAFMASIRSAV
jgi:hypothetical protein